MQTNKFLQFLICPKCKTNNLKFKIKKKILCLNCSYKSNFISLNNQIIPNLIFGLKNQLKKNPKDKNFLVKAISKNKCFYPKKKLGFTSLDLGCGESPRGDCNVDCFLPNPIPKNFILANTDHIPFKKNSFDTIYSFYNIEHMENPSKYIKDLLYIARKEVFIVTDNSEWIGDIFFRIIGSGRIYHKEHCYKWSKEYMENLLKRIGISNFIVTLENHSFSPLVKFFYFFSKIIPKLKFFVSRDLVIRIKNKE